jgi:hypothetical protein
MGVLSDNQLAALLRQVGVPAGDAAYLVAIAHPESGANPASIQQGQPYDTTGWGLWQITPGDSVPGVGVNNALLSPENNARAAKDKLDSQGLDAWTTYTGGLYQPYFADAESAVSDVYGMSQADVAKLAASAGKGGAAGTSPSSGIGGAVSDIIGALSLPFSWGADVLNGPSDVAKALLGVASPLVKITESIDWFFHPGHIIRLLCGGAGSLLVLGGAFQMFHTGGEIPVSAYGVSTSVGIPRAASLPMGILFTGIGGLLLFVAFHNLPDTVETFPDFLGYLTDELKSGSTAGVTG